MIQKIKQKFLDIKTHNKIMALILLLWATNLLIFGSFSSDRDWWMFVISIPLMAFLVDYKWFSENDAKFFGPTFWYAALSGIILGSFDLSPFNLMVREPLVQITIDASFSIIGYWVSILCLVPLASYYRRSKRAYYNSQFETENQKQRDIKINSILGNWRN